MFACLPEAIWICTITPVGWSDRDSNFEKENDVKAVNNKEHKEAVSVICK